MNVKPLGDRVLVKVEQGEEKTKGGLFIPDTAKEKTTTGLVEAVGDDTEAISVKVGDKVMYDKYAGTSISIDDEDYLVIRAEDLLAVVS